MLNEMNGSNKAILAMASSLCSAHRSLSARELHLEEEEATERQKQEKKKKDGK